MISISRRFLAVPFGFLVLGAFATAQAPKVKGKPAPSFQMTSLKGEKITNASLKGKVVILDFWATWCPPCRAASPTMEALHRKYGSKGLRVIGANSFERENIDGAAAKYAKEHGYTYTFTRRNDALATKLGAEGIPFFVILDRKGVVREVLTGFDAAGSPKQMEAIVRRLLAQKA